jgi:magnesium transporter
MVRFRKRHTAAGARPGTLMIPPDAPEPRLRVVSYDADSLEERALLDVADLRALPSGRKHWIDVQGLGSEDVLRAIGAHFRLHPLALEDVVNVPQRPKVEDYAEHTLLVTRQVEWTRGSSPRFAQVAIFVGSGYVLTFQEQQGGGLDPILERLRAGVGPIRSAGVDYLAYAILDAVVDGYYPIVQHIGERLEQMEARVLTRPSPRMLDILGQAKSLLVTMRRVMRPQRDALDQVLKADESRFSDDVLVYLRDTLDHCNQLVEGIDSDRDVASGLMNTYLSVVGHRTNDIMRVLTIMASIFIPLTFMAGVYGMNFDSMPELHTPWAYPLLLAVMTLTAFGMVGYFWRAGWIGISSRERDDDEDLFGS